MKEITYYLKLFGVSVAEMLLAYFLRIPETINERPDIDGRLDPGHFLLTVFPSVIALSVFASILEKEKDNLPLSFQKPMLLVHAMLLGIFFTVHSHLSFLQNEQYE